MMFDLLESVSQMWLFLYYLKLYLCIGTMHWFCYTSKLISNLQIQQAWKYVLHNKVNIISTCVLYYDNSKMCAQNIGKL
jgi:hypothetical protein